MRKKVEQKNTTSSTYKSDYDLVVMEDRSVYFVYDDGRRVKASYKQPKKD